MKLFDFLKPRSARDTARQREREMMRKLGELLDIGDEETLKKALQEDFGIDPADSRYQEVLKIWRGQR